MDINRFLSKLDKDSVERLSGILNTPRGQELARKLKNFDKDNIMKQLEAIDEGDLPRGEILRRITENPDLLQKLNDFLDRK